MRKLSVFNNVSMDGYFTSPSGDYTWANTPENDQEFNGFVADNASGGGELVLGRVTYDIMASFWPTPAATQQMPEVAKGMNGMHKTVFSRTMRKADWANTTVLSGDLVSEIKRLKSEPGDDMAILGSGSIVAQLASHGVVDEYQFVMVPVVIGAGRTMFDDMKGKLSLKLTKTRAFKNGRVYLCYEPKK